MKKIIYFLAEASIYAFSRNMAIFAKSLAHAGESGLFTFCTGQFTRCSVFDAQGLGANLSKEIKQEICSKCQKFSHELSQKHSIPLLFLENFITTKDKTKIDSIINSASNDLFFCVYKNIPIGKLAYRSVSIATKDDTKIFSGERLTLMQEYVRTSLEASIIAENIIQQIHPDAVLYGQEYAIEMCIKEVCKEHGILYTGHTITILNGYDFGRLFFYHQPLFKQLMDMVSLWDNYKEIAIKPDEVRSSFDDIFCRNYLTGNAHIYSPQKKNDPEDLIKKLNLKPECKTIVLYTSSPDERKSLAQQAEIEKVQLDIKDLFPDQFVWLQKVCSYVQVHSELQLVIRMHPRLGADWRSHIPCIYLEKFKQVLCNIPDQCHVVWPQDPISSYDLAELADLVLISWSTMGKELARIGVPVIATSQNLHYPDADFIQIPNSEEEYFAAIEQTLKADYTYTTLVHAIRFSHFVSELPVFDLRKDLGSTLPDPQKEVLPLIAGENINMLKKIFFSNFEILKYNVENFKNSSNNSEKDEMKTLFNELGYFILNTFFPPHLENEQGLQYSHYLKSLLKKLLPFCMVLSLKKALNMFNNILKNISSQNQRGREIFPRNNYVFQICSDIDQIKECIAQSKSDPRLHIFLGTDKEFCLIKAGQIYRRKSKLLIRQFKILNEIEKQIS